MKCRIFLFGCLFCLFLFPLVFFSFLAMLFALYFCNRVFKQSLYKSFHIGVIIITLFVYVLSFHIGWNIILLITYPLQVGTLILTIVVHYIALAFIGALVVHYFKKRPNQESSMKILLIDGFFFCTLQNFLVIYYQMLGKYPHEDGITKFLPSLIPALFIGFFTWIAKVIIFSDR